MSVQGEVPRRPPLLPKDVQARRPGGRGQQAGQDQTQVWHEAGGQCMENIFMVFLLGWFLFPGVAQELFAYCHGI